MKIKFTENHLSNTKGTYRNFPDGIATQFIQLGVAKEVDEKEFANAVKKNNERIAKESAEKVALDKKNQKLRDEKAEANKPSPVSTTVDRSTPEADTKKKDTGSEDSGGDESE